MKTFKIIPLVFILIGCFAQKQINQLRLTSNFLDMVVITEGKNCLQEVSCKKLSILNYTNEKKQRIIYQTEIKQLLRKSVVYNLYYASSPLLNKILFRDSVTNRIVIVNQNGEEIASFIEDELTNIVFSPTEEFVAYSFVCLSDPVITGYDDGFVSETRTIFKANTCVNLLNLTTGNTTSVGIDIDAGFLEWIQESIIVGSNGNYYDVAEGKWLKRKEKSISYSSTGTWNFELAYLENNYPQEKLFLEKETGDYRVELLPQAKSSYPFEYSWSAKGDFALVIPTHLIMANSDDNSLSWLNLREKIWSTSFKEEITGTFYSPYERLNLRWSRNGEHLAFFMENKGKQQLIVVDKSSKLIYELGFFESVKPISWSSDNENIAFVDQGKLMLQNIKENTPIALDIGANFENDTLLDVLLIDN